MLNSVVKSEFSVKVHTDRYDLARRRAFLLLHRPLTLILSYSSLIFGNT